MTWELCAILQVRGLRLGGSKLCAGDHGGARGTWVCLEPAFQPRCTHCSVAFGHQSRPWGGQADEGLAVVAGQAAPRLLSREMGVEVS